MKLISRFINYIGVFFIFTFSLLAIFLDLMYNDIADTSIFKKPIAYMTSFESRFYDYRMKPNLHKVPRSNNIVLVEIDDKSLQEINSWPIPRENWATLMDNLGKFGANTVVFDVLFPEPVKTCGENSPDEIFKESILRFQSLPIVDKDAPDIAEKMVEHNQEVIDEFSDTPTRTAILAYSMQERHLEFEEGLLDEPPFELLLTTLPGLKRPACEHFKISGVEKHTWPIEELTVSEAYLGYLNMMEDNDGVFRHYSLFSLVPSKENETTFFFPSLALAAFKNWPKVSDFKIEINDQCLASMDINGKSIKTNSYGDTKIRWTGTEEKFKSISLYRVLNGKNFDNVNLRDFFYGKTVFVGSTATGAHDLRNSAIDPKMPGVYAHMNMLNMLQKEFFFKPSQKSLKYTLLVLCLGMVILTLIMILGKPLLDIVTLSLLVAITYYIDQIKLIPEGYQLKLFYCYFCFGATYSWVTILNFNQSNAEKKQIKGAFSRYVAPSIVDDMLDNPDKLKVGGEKRDITCMFSDVRDFTSISEALSPTDLAMALNKYMGKMTDIVFETNGTLDKYIGDAIVAFWGAPIDIGDHVNQAVDAGVQMLEALPAVNAEFKKLGFPEFKIGLGLNSGECSVGNMGSDQIFAYTALGDNMNLGARLESLCKYYGAQILISEYTYNRLDHERFTCRLIDNVIVKGKTEPVGVYEVLYSYHKFMIDQQALTQFRKAFDLFLDGKFNEAKAIFTDLNQKYPDDKASHRMMETCAHWIETPPLPDEDFRVTTMKTKG